MLQPRGLVLVGLLLCAGAEMGQAAPPVHSRPKDSQVQKRKAFVAQLQDYWVQSCKANKVEVTMILEATGPLAKEVVVFEARSWSDERAEVLFGMKKKFAELGFTSMVLAQIRKKGDSPESLYILRDEKTKHRLELTVFRAIKI